jgi:hypothetical protein
VAQGVGLSSSPSTAKKFGKNKNLVTNALLAGM